MVFLTLEAHETYPFIESQLEGIWNSQPGKNQMQMWIMRSGSLIQVECHARRVMDGDGYTCGPTSHAPIAEATEFGDLAQEITLWEESRLPYKEDTNLYKSTNFHRGNAHTRSIPTWQMRLWDTRLRFSAGVFLISQLDTSATKTAAEGGVTSMAYNTFLWKAIWLINSDLYFAD